jgi:integrase/recombinase XerD
MDKRSAIPRVSAAGQQALEQFESSLRAESDMQTSTVRNYVSDLRLFVAWFETTWAEGSDVDLAFAPEAVTTPLITRYRTYLQQNLQLKPASVNRSLVSLKRYFAWACATGVLPRNPATVVKLVGAVSVAPRHLKDTEEDALVAAVTAAGSLRDRTMIILMLHTGLRASEICGLRRNAITLDKRSGVVAVTGKRNKYREVPLNLTARQVLKEYWGTLPRDESPLFPSEKTGGALTERAIGYIVRRYAALARRFGYRMAESVPLHRLAQIMGHDSLDTTMIYVQATKADLQREVEKIAWA